MATPVTHAVAALAIGSPWYRREMPKRVWITAAVCSILPDLDAIGFHFGIRYYAFWGHRGFSHSILFAALLAAIAALVLRSTTHITRAWLFVYLFLATASHGLLDAMTDGGLGVAFLSPFSKRRYFLPWRPIRVSPIAISRFFSARAISILETELIWVWVPSALFALSVFILKRNFGKGK